MSGGSSTQQSQQSTQSNTINPQSLALLQGNYQTAQNNAASLTPYQGQLTAGFTPTQTQAQGILSNVATDPTYSNVNNTASNAVQGVLGSNPNTTVTNQGVTASPINANTYGASTYNPNTATASNYTAAQLAGTDLTPYENPFTSDVINTSLAGINQQQNQALLAGNQSATAAGAFGGSRSGVSNALTKQLYDQDAQSTIAGLNSANFAQAQAAAEGDIGARNTASQYNATNNQNVSLANAGILNAAGQYNASNTQNANAANANALNSAQEFNSTQGLNAGEYNATQNQSAQQASIANALAAQGLQLNAAGQLVSTNNNGLALAQQQGGILSAVGDAQQQQQQTELTNAYNAYTQGQQLTVQQQQLLNSALGLIPTQQTVSSSGSGSSSTTTNPGLAGILGGLGSVAQGAAAFA